MARVTSTGSLKRRYAVSKNYQGLVTKVYMDSLTTYTKSTLNRADMQRQLMRIDGWRDPTTYFTTYTTADAGFCDIIVDNPNNKRYFVNKGGIHAPQVEPRFVISEAMLNTSFPSTANIDKSIVKARNNVADRVASFGESLLELYKSLSGIGALASQISEFIIAAERGNTNSMAKALGLDPKARKVRRAAKAFRLTKKSIWQLNAKAKAEDKAFRGVSKRSVVESVSNAFLTYNFGLSPIVSDMVSLAILIGEGKNLRCVGKGSVYEKERTSMVSLPCNVDYAAVGAYNMVFKEHINAGTYTRLDYEVSAEKLRELTSFGLLDAPQNLWAIAPYSFMVDFVLPVSEVLRSLTATFGLTFMGGTTTRFTRVTRKFAFSTKNELGPSLKWVSFIARCDDLSGLKMVRTVHLSDPNPATLWVKDPFGAFEAATTFSVLAQRLLSTTTKPYR